MADNYVMRVRNGDTYRLRLTYTDPSNVAMNLTGYTFEWSVKVGEVIQTYTGSPQITVTTPANGVIDLLLSAVVTATFLTGRGRFYFKAIPTVGEADTLLEGGVDVEFNE